MSPVNLLMMVANVEHGMEQNNCFLIHIVLWNVGQHQWKCQLKQFQNFGILRWPFVSDVDVTNATEEGGAANNLLDLNVARLGKSLKLHRLMCLFISFYEIIANRQKWWTSSRDLIESIQ